MRLYIAPIISALVLLSSCRDDRIHPGVSPSNAIGIMASGNTYTKSSPAPSQAHVTCAEEELFSIPFQTDDGQNYRLVITVSDMSDDGPATKGTPIYNSNLGLASGYTTFQTSVFDGATAYIDPDSKSMANVTVEYDATVDASKPDKPGWNFAGGTYYWPEDESKELTFCSYAPITTNGVRSDLTWNLSSADKTATFSYALPAPSTASPYNDAASQQDLLFAIDTQDRNDHKRLVNGEDVHFAQIHFYHALTAVRFTRGKELNDCHINVVSMENFYSNADAIFDPSKTDVGDKFVWTNHDGITTFRQEYDCDIKDSDSDPNTYVPRASTATDPGASLDPTERDADPNNNGEYTFMMIPQELPSDAKISVTVEGRLHPIEFPIGAPSTGNTTNDARLKDWSAYAGKMITIRIESEKMDMVRVSVDDEASGQVKSNIVTANTGRNGVYMRVALIANCTNKDNIMVRPCRIGNTANPGNIDYEGDGTFTKATNWGDYWVFNSADGFYYYKYIVPSGKKTAVDLFETFTVKPGLITGTGEGINIYHVLFDVIVQGVDAGAGTTEQPYTKDGVDKANWTFIENNPSWFSIEAQGINF